MRSSLEMAAVLWHRWTGSAYLKAYLETADGAGFLPRSVEDCEIMLNAFLMDKAVYEVGYELNSRPAWVRIPLRGILDLLKSEST
jgi:maltose alpha-D-glucosyltransferase/alpha-amylase